MNVLEIQNVTKRFGNLVAVRDVSLDVGEGRVARDHRAERRRQDHLLQPDQRLFPADLRAPSCSTATTSRRCRRISASRSAWPGRSRSPRFFPSSPYSRTSASPPRWPADIACGPGSAARKRAQIHRHVEETLKLVVAGSQDRPAGRRTAAWRSARRRDRDGAGAAAASAAARRADRRHGRPGDLPDHPA